MKTLILIFISQYALAANFDPYTIASAHLIKHGYGKGEILLEQETFKNWGYFERFAIDNDRATCHVGVIIDKEFGYINLGKYDKELNFDKPYSDTFYLVDKYLVLTCAD